MGTQWVSPCFVMVGDVKETKRRGKGRHVRLGMGSGRVRINVP